ncbi:polyprenyl synthetase family protein [Verticiella sediminum]|uniref:Polyprenyl synthetase family protein n=1 Tax=Verticiella sediminum TaxID=1247510 RepID=A0A556ACC9_9BURK|nr:farnesyl diphosphate synthase [Verticiella sediminum]TSH90542.1 polyprenyl synthetase family protein [Verticiella sediminum]
MSTITTLPQFASWLESARRRCEDALARHLPKAEDVPAARLHDAMRYAVLGGGKRVRAALVYAAGAACGSATQPVANGLDAAAAAVEFIHAYSLVHDDLPCMDDDVMRRGRPTLHVQFDEACALLAGDALQPLAFGCLAQMPIAPALVAQAVRTLAEASGSLGMVGGQAIDLDSVGRRLSLDELETMHRMKTGALLRASVALGAVVAGAASPMRRSLDTYAQAIGLAFQVVDDVLDVSADSAALGKTAGKDAAENKPTYVSLLGLERARELAEALRIEAHNALRELGEGQRIEPLAGLADYIVLRDR